MITSDLLLSGMSQERDHNESSLLANLRSGSADAFEQIFRLHWHPLYRIAKSKLRSHEEAEEVVQSIFSTLWEKRETLLITNLTHYLHVALRNRILNILRDKITQDKYSDYCYAFIPREENATENLVVYSDLRDAVEVAVNHLPEKSREVFRLSRLEGRSNAEIAKLLKVSEKAIEYHLTRSLKELKVQLRDFKIQ